MFLLFFVVKLDLMFYRMTVETIFARRRGGEGGREREREREN